MRRPAYRSADPGDVYKRQVVALIASAGLSILNLVAFDGGSARLDNVNWLGLGTFITAFFILRRLKWNPILVMILCGAAGLFLNLPAGMV